MADEYERIGARAARGVYTLVDPLDYLLLAELPKEGETIGGVHPLAETVRSLGKKLKAAKLTPDQLSGRLRSMEVQGLSKNIVIVGGAGWQITPSGQKVLDEWKASHKEVEDGNETTN